jgi:hypothetical protein
VPLSEHGDEPVLSAQITRQTRPAPEASPNAVVRGGERPEIAQSARSAKGRTKSPIEAAPTREKARRTPAPAHAANQPQPALAAI